jgi:Ser/Thr protein kinase RdoA (MazF antagonist)
MPPLTPALASALLATLQRHGLIPDTAGWRTMLAPGGSTDRTFSVVDPAGLPRLTVRLARPGLGDRLRHEEAVLRELAREDQTWTPARIARLSAPELPGGALLVHEHLPGEPAPLDSASAAARDSFATCLAWVHGHTRSSYTLWPDVTPRDGTRSTCFRERLTTLDRYMSAGSDLPGVPDLLGRLGALDLPESAGWRVPGFALLHGDLSLGNILWQADDVALIDWEFARDGDPAEDLAYLVADQDLAPETVADLADTYVAAGGDPWAFARLPAWLPLVALDAALWWADYWLRQGQPSTHPDVLERLGRARRYLGR